MHIVVKTVDVGSIKAVIVVAADENLVSIWQIAEPVHEVDCLGFTSVHGKIAGMDHHIGFGQIPKSAVAAMRIREM